MVTLPKCWVLLEFLPEGKWLLLRGKLHLYHFGADIKIEEKLSMVTFLYLQQTRGKPKEIVVIFSVSFKKQETSLQNAHTGPAAACHHVTSPSAHQVQITFISLSEYSS